jgi:hypothetical protein
LGFFVSDFVVVVDFVSDFVVVVDFVAPFEESIAIFDESIAGAGAAAGAAAAGVEAGVSSAFLHATRATTERASARRFIESP